MSNQQTERSGPSVTRDELRDPSRLRRVVQGRQIAGVAGGVARFLNVDPIVVRVIWVVAVLFGGVGIFAYVALWVLLPEDGSAHQPFGLDDRNRGYLVLGIVVLAALGLLGNSWGWFDVPWPLLIVGGAVALFMSQRGREMSGFGPQAADNQPVDQQSQTGRTWNGSAWVPAATFPGVPTPPVTSPTKRGPLLFWWTMLAVVVAMASMAAFGISTVSAYPAVALGILAVAMLVGAFWGRAGGLLVVGLMLVPALGLARAVEVIDDEAVTWQPTSAAQVLDTYHRSLGSAVLDLSKVSNPEALVDRTIRASVDVGSLTVILPPEASWKAAGSVDLGKLTMNDQYLEGPDVNWSLSSNQGKNPDRFTLDAQVNLGELKVTTAELTGLR